MRDFFIVVRAPKDHDVTLRTLGLAVLHSERNMAMAVATQLADVNGEDYVVLGVVGRAGPSSPHDNSHEFIPTPIGGRYAVGVCR